MRRFSPVGVLILSGALTQAAPEARMPEAQRAFFQSYCLNCHNEEKQKGKMRLDDISFVINDIPTAERWQKILTSLNSKEMPPAEEKQPTAEEKTVFLEQLSKQMVVARKALADTGGVITMRRLNKREYVNTMRDLLDVEVNAFDLPSDERNGSFDTVGSGLFFSSDQFEQYLKIARAALDDAIVTGPRPERKVVRVEAEETANKEMVGNYESNHRVLQRIREWRKSGRPAKEFGFGDDNQAGMEETVYSGGELRALAYLNNPLTRTGAISNFGTRPPTFEIPQNAPAGQYVLRTRVAFPGVREGARRFVELGARGDQGWPNEMRVLGCFPVDATPERPDVLEIPIEVTRTGYRAYAVRERCYNTARSAERQSSWVRTGVPMDTRRPHGLEITQPDVSRFLWVDWFEWEGPLHTLWPPRSHRAVFGSFQPTAQSGPEDARRIIEDFAAKAFRGKPVRPEFVDKLMGHFEEQRQAGKDFVEAIKTPLSIVLASPKFLYIVEPSTRPEGAPPERSPETPLNLDDLKKKADESPSASTRVPLTNAEFANRLSYFLWSGPPDQILVSLAESGRLGTASAISTGYQNQIDRMLLDPRTARFISGFVHQWLHMARLDFFQFNPRLYPKFDSSLRANARREVYETILYVLKNDLPLGTLLKSDFVVVNDVLADYYGISDVRGSVFRKVNVPDGIPRGGLLSMAATLAMGSDGERSSPVERGAWVLRKLLHDPPPPAPANVPQLSRFGDKLMPANKLLQAHMEEPQCKQCHQRIDPIGYALQNFDAAGLWREEEYTEFFKQWGSIEKKQVFPLFASGHLPNGPEFEGFYGLRDAVAQHEEDFVRGMVEHLVEYALGRPCGFSDAELVENLVKRAKSKGMTLRSIIHALVLSREFRTK
jgi:hypothetical protein